MPALFVFAVVLSSCSGSAPPTPRGRAHVAAASGDPAVEVGANASCARLRSGRVVCWGDNHWGQLGDGTSLPADRPIEVVGIRDAVDLMSDVRCARLSQGSIRCWGDVTCRDCAHDDPTAPHLATLPSGTAWVESLGSGQSRPYGPATYLVDERGRVSFDGTEVFDELPPMRQVAIASLDCGVSRAGTVHCWQLGCEIRLSGGACEERRRPFALALPPNVEHLAAGSHLCARTSDGAVFCLDPAASAPAQRVPLPGAAVQIVSDGDHACARLETAAVRCWRHGQPADNWLLGHGTSVAAGGARTCIVGTAGTVRCWEHSSLVEPGELVDGIPFRPPPPPPPLDSTEAIARLLGGATRREIAPYVYWEVGLVRGDVYRQGDASDPPMAALHCLPELLLRVPLPNLEGLRCAEDLARCWTASQELFFDVRGGRRFLSRIGDRYGAPGEVVPIAELELEPDREACHLVRRLARHDRTLISDDLWSYRETFAIEFDPGVGPPPGTPLVVELEHLCGEAAARASRSAMGVVARLNDEWSCEDLWCIRAEGHGDAAVIAFRPDPDGTIRLWAIGWVNSMGGGPAPAAARERMRTERCAP